MLKMSELYDSVEVGKEGTSHILTVGEIKGEIEKFGKLEYGVEGWYTEMRKRWAPDASWMIESYIENESTQMYEDWGEMARDCITKEVKGKIQKILVEAFKDDTATLYWESLEPVEIDIK